ncbi:MAG: transcriptional repressor [Desulfobacterota bacterium]|nr:transcriptional repressor [Thermodesulfobacteriota bacterium]
MKGKTNRLKATPQRMAILAFLEGNKEHPSAEMVYKAVSKKFPTISLATVYNTLSALTKHGQLGELHFDPYKKRFDPNPQPHPHAICIKCQRILDVKGEIPLDFPELETDRFEWIGAHIEFYGICSTCKGKKQI